MSYSRVASHGPMLFDANRNELYGRAIRKLAHPKSVVLDLGAGLGIHGLLAASAGAARVYLVEPQPVVHAALEVARAGGLAERLIILQKRIEDVQLPKPVDFIISVFTGNLLFSEDLLPSLFHARDRYLKPGGRLLPDRAQLWLAPLNAPQLHKKHVARWSDPIMGLDYSSVRRFAANEILWLRREEFAGTHRLSKGAALADVDLTTSSTGDCCGEAHSHVDASGLCHGLLGWIRVRLLDQWLSTEPDGPEVHWSPVLLPIDPPLPVMKGEELKLTLLRPAYGDWTWSVAAQAGSRRHSSFLGRTDSAKELARVAPASSPGLGEQGQVALDILMLLREGLSNQAIAEKLARTSRVDDAEALRQVQLLAKQYGGQP
jgi:SAM-dependent methyltransferase